MRILDKLKQLIKQIFPFLFSSSNKSIKKNSSGSSVQQEAHLDGSDQEKLLSESVPVEEIVSETEKMSDVSETISESSPDEKIDLSDEQEVVREDDLQSEPVVVNSPPEPIEEVQKPKEEDTGTLVKVDDSVTVSGEVSPVSMVPEEDVEVEDNEEVSDEMEEEDFNDALSSEVEDDEQRQFVQVEKTFEGKPSSKPVFARYYRSYLRQRDISNELNDVEKEKYLSDLKNDRCDQFAVMSLQTIETILFSLTKDLDLIGELPISEKCFRMLVEVTREKAVKHGSPYPKAVPPALFMTLMVFCARYSHEEASKFWEPYVKEVWGQLELDQAFQVLCRKHFINCRRDLEHSQGKQFFFYTEGGVVRPVYQHAIIPYYLESDFIDWMIKNFEALLKYSAVDLPYVLAKGNSLNTLPYTFQHFITDKDTAKTAASLIRHIAQAVKRFQITHQKEEVLSLMSSMIERNLFEKIIQRILSQEVGQKQLRAYSVQLQWVWLPEEETLGLRLNNVKAPTEEKPDFVVCVQEGVDDLINSRPSQDIDPWKSRQGGGWEVDPVIFTEPLPHRGHVYVLSEAFNVRNPEEQENHILFKGRIPQFPADFLCFRVDTQRHYAIGKSEVDSEGTWLIFSKEDYDILDDQDSPIKYHEAYLGRELKSEDFITARQYELSFPFNVVSEGQKRTIDHNSQIKFSYSILGDKEVPHLSNDVLPVYQSREIRLKLIHGNCIQEFGRYWLSVIVNREFQQSISLRQLLEQGKIQREADFLLIDLSSYVHDSGSYSVDILRNLQSLFDEAVQFSILDDDIEIKAPDRNICYSPQHPPRAEILGVDQENVLSEQSEKTKISSIQGGVQVVWPLVKSASPGLVLQFDQYNVHLKWPIRRVSAWIEPRRDTGEVFAGEEDEITVIHIRGDKHQGYEIRIRESDSLIRGDLDAKGRFDYILIDCQLYDLLREAKRVTSTVELQMQGMSWELFRYISKPSLELKPDGIVYLEGEGLSIKFSMLEYLKADYELNLRDRNEKVVFQKEYDQLQSKMILPVELLPGEYSLELLADNISVYVHDGILIKPKITTVENSREVAIKVGQSVDKYEFFEVLSSPPSFLLKFQDKSENLIPLIKQLIAINSRHTSHLTV